MKFYTAVLIPWTEMVIGDWVLGVIRKDCGEGSKPGVDVSSIKVD